MCDGYSALRNIATTKFAVKFYSQVCKQLIKNTLSCRFAKIKTDNESEKNDKQSYAKNK